MKTVLNIKTDKTIKQQAQKVAKELGLSLSTIMNAYLKEFVREKSVYFSLAPKMSPRLERLVAGIEHDIKKKKRLSPLLRSSEEINKYLDSLK